MAYENLYMDTITFVSIFQPSFLCNTELQSIGLILRWYSCSSGCSGSKMHSHWLVNSSCPESLVSSLDPGLPKVLAPALPHWSLHKLLEYF